MKIYWNKLEDFEFLFFFSFTYGAATHAQYTFPYLVGEYIGGTTKNAGACSYRLAQMVIIGKRLIPRHKPDYVIVQYSDWLVSRAVRVFAPSYFGKLTTPFYAEEDDPVIKQPVSKQRYGNFLSMSTVSHR